METQRGWNSRCSTLALTTAGCEFKNRGIWGVHITVKGNPANLRDALSLFLRLNRKMVLRHILRLRRLTVHMTSPKLTLATAQCGDRLRVRHICPDCPHCVRLRELGFHDRTVLRKIADGAAVICLLMGTRVAVGRELCNHVEVERLAA